MKKALLIIAICLFTAAFLYAGYRVIDLLRENEVGEESYAGLMEYVSVQTPEPKPTPSDSEPLHEEQTFDPELLWPEVDFDVLREINPDVIGWLYCEGTEINYPVVQGDDNSYYLSHLFDGTRNANGCLFVDCKNSDPFRDPNTIIYGHHMKNKTMFHALDGYKKQSFYEEHPTAMILTPEANYLIEFFSGYVASVEDNAWELGFTSAGYADWLEEAKNRSCFSSPIEPTVDDCVVTLSTCSYEFSDARFVVVGVSHKYAR